MSRVKQIRRPYEKAFEIFIEEMKIFADELAQHDLCIERISTAGSLRRKRKTIGDFDFVITLNDNEKFRKIHNDLNYSKLTKTFFKKRVPEKQIEFDMFLSEDYNWGNNLFFLTGSEDWNQKTMKHLIRNSKYRFLAFKWFNTETNERVYFDSEDKIFKILQIPYVYPEDRSLYRYRF